MQQKHLHLLVLVLALAATVAVTIKFGFTKNPFRILGAFVLFAAILGIAVDNLAGIVPS